MNRRSFLTALGLGSGATAVAGCGLDDNRYYTPVEKLLPYVTHPIQSTPGTPSFFATAVGTGPRAWPVVSTHRSGRVVNVGANQVAHARGNLGQGERNEVRAPRAVAGSNLFDLQRHYSPDRVRRPTRGGESMSWEDGLEALGDAAAKAQRDGKRIAYVGPYSSGTLPYLLDQITGGNALFWEPLGLDNELLAARALLGTSTLPRYNLARARYVLSFGAPFLGDAWGNPAHQADYARGRNANEGNFVARFAAVTPLRDQTAANADEWYACNPGSEAQVALAVARIVARKRAYLGAGQELLERASVDTAATKSGLTTAQINEIADRFASGSAVALPGGLVGSSPQGTLLAAATYLLNIVAGSQDLFTSGGYPGPISTFAELEDLIAEMNAGRVGLLLLGDLDLSHVLPNAESFRKALANVETSVAVTSFPSATTAAATMMLPTHSVFEDWGDEEPVQGLRIVRQPGMSPLHDTRSLGDLALTVWRALDSDNAPGGGWHEYLMARWAADVFDPYVRRSGSPLVSVGAEESGARARNPTPPAPGADFRRWWEGVLADGFFVTQLGGTPLRVDGTLPDDSGSITGSGEYYLIAYPHPFTLDGRYANEPWAQETPDPMTGHVWDTWALVHPHTAARLGVGDNHTIEITTDAGSLRVGVEVHPCVKENVIAVPLGGGHEAAKGRYASDVGANVVRVLKAQKDRLGALSWQQTRCAVRSVNRPADLHSTFGVYPRDYAPGSDLTNESDAQRNFVALVPAAEWSKHGDEPSDHPGELTGIHHLPWDERLDEAGVHNFYPLPDHPVYRFGMTVDTNACTGCGACAVACYAENNLPVVGKEKVKQGREMNWIRINRYFREGSGGHGDSPTVHFIPMMCQHCGHAPCESVCPVLATYHSIDGLNAMVYNRCVGTRYCSNACPYSARKFNYHTYVWPEPFQLQLNPDVSTRTMGVMEKCTFCVQRIRRTKSAYRDRGFDRTVPAQALEQLTACAEACPSQAITFGNLNDEEVGPGLARKSARNYIPIAEINTFPAVNYMARASFHFEPGHHGGGHADQAGDHGSSSPSHDPAPHGAGDH